MKFDTYSNSNTKNSMVMFTFLFFNDILFYEKFGSENQNYVLKPKFGTETNLIV